MSFNQDNLTVSCLQPRDYLPTNCSSVYCISMVYIHPLSSWFQLVKCNGINIRVKVLVLIETFIGESNIMSQNISVSFAKLYVSEIINMKPTKFPSVGLIKLHRCKNLYNQIQITIFKNDEEIFGKYVIPQKKIFH